MQQSFRRIAAFPLILFSIAALSLSAAAFSAAGSSAFAQSSAQDRIVQPMENGKLTALAGTVHPKAQARYDQGAVSGSLQLRGMSIDFSRTPSQQAALAALLKAQQDPSSPSYRKWLTPQQYAEQFGMTQSDISKVTAWLQSQGFTVDKVADSRAAIWFSGTAATANAAFHTSIHKYLVNGETHFANAAAVSLPSALAGTVTRVGGLNDFKPKPQLVHPAKASKNGVTPAFTSGVSGDHFIQPGDFAVIYDMNPLYTAGFTGSGVTIGVIGQTDIVQADITDFRSAAGLPAYVASGSGPTFTSYLIPTSSDPGTQIASGDLGEADLDIEWSGGVATNANIVFVNSTDVFSSLQYAIANQINGLTIPILTLSYGGCEAGFSAAEIDSLEASFEEAGAQGQTVINSAGDSGAAACDDESETVTAATQGFAVNYPASSAYVTGLGGSEFMGDGTAANPSTGSDQYWSANGSNDVLTSALSYIPEMAWNDTTFDIDNGGGLSSGGGGASILFVKPSWQTGVAGIPADGKRDVPDISIDASADHDGYLYCTEIVLDSNSGSGTYSPSCANGFRISDPDYEDDAGLSAVGGTSVSAPSFAGILAAIEQKLGAPLGNINPDLYSLASNSSVYASAFHDITTGNNDVPCASDSPDCPTSGTLEFGYSAGVGYDQATGLGSVDGNELATAFTTVETKAGTTAAVTASSATVAVNQAVTFIATITPNNGSATAPTGTVSFTVDSATPVVEAVAAGAASYAYPGFSTGGLHTVTAAYSGDSNYFASTTTYSVTVSATGNAPTTTTLTTGGATSVALNQGSITLTATVNSTTSGTVAGQVAFTIGSVALAPIQVTPGASGTATASATVQATEANGFGSAAGTVNITAAYQGDSDYAPSTSAAVPIAVTNPALTLTVANMTISSASPGNTGTSAISVTSTGGYSGTVDLSATASSLNANYSINPTSLAIASGATGTASISIETIAASIKNGASGNLKHATPTSNNRVIAGAAVAFGCICLLGVPGFRKKRWPALTVLLLLGALGAGIGCGGGGNSGASPGGTYTVTVTATDSLNSAITTSTNFTVTIQ